MKIKVELEIECRAFTPEELAEEAKACSMTVEELGAETDDELDAHEIGWCVAGMFSEDMDMEMFAGTNIYVKLGDATLIRAEMLPA